VKLGREKYGLRVFENRVLREVDGVKMDLPYLCCSPNVTGAVKQGRIRWVRACSTHGADEKITLKFCE
jgi:hypothetical protein